LNKIENTFRNPEKPAQIIIAQIIIYIWHSGKISWCFEEQARKRKVHLPLLNFKKILE